MKKKNKINKRIVLTFLSQQYGLTVEDLIRRNPELKKEDVIVSKSAEGDVELLGISF